MARSIANQQQLFVAEVEAGTPETTGFQKWTGIKIMPGWEGAAEPYKGGSSKVATSVEMVDETAALSATLSADFNHLGYVAASRIALPATTTPGGGTLSRQHVFALNPDSEDTKRTYTLLLGDAWEAQRVDYAAFNTLGMDIKRGAVEFSTGMIGRAGEYGYELPTSEVQTLTKSGAPTSGTWTLTLPWLANGAGLTTAVIALTATSTQIKAAIVALAGIDADDLDVTGGPINTTPVVVTFKGRYGQRDLALMVAADTFDVGDVTVAQTTPGANPVSVTDAPIPSIAWDVYADDTWATIGSTKLLACYQGNIDLGDKFTPDAPINSAIISFESLIENEDQDYGFTLVVGVDSAAIGLITSFKAGAKKYMRLKVTGPIIEGAIPYYCAVDFCLVILSRGEVSAAPNSPVASIPLTCAIAKDPTTGNAFQITLVNSVLTY